MSEKKSENQFTLLTELKQGQVARIIDINQDNEDARCRMLSLVIYPGVTVELLRSAPMGDPLQIRCGSTLISIRKAEASRIGVTL